MKAKVIELEARVRTLGDFYGRFGMTEAKQGKLAEYMELVYRARTTHFEGVLVNIMKQRLEPALAMVRAQARKDELYTPEVEARTHNVMKALLAKMLGAEDLDLAQEQGEGA